jgi:hypothetical protein
VRCPLFIVRDLVTATGSPWSPVERLVALGIADHMNGAGEAWPSQRAVAAWTGYSLRSVQEALGRLTGPGGIFDEETGGSRKGKRRTVSHYRLRAAAPHAIGTTAEAPPIWWTG